MTATFLLFLKMAQEIGIYERQLPRRLVLARPKSQGRHRAARLVPEAPHPTWYHGSERVQAIFANAQTCIIKPKNLKTLVVAIDALDWYSTKEEDLGDMY
jgi:type I restriction enzyme M protein